MHRSKRLTVGRVIVISLLSGLSIWACGGSSDEKLQAAKLAEGCDLNSECESPLVCTFQRCHRECAQDRDCTRGEERCVVGADGAVCQLPDETACEKTRDCNGEQVCGGDGECRDTCTKDADCIEGQLCANSGECASKDPTKDVVDESGNILPDSFGDGENAGGSGGGGNSSNGGTGAVSGGGSGGSAGSAGEPGTGGVPGACAKGWADCDRDPSECETDLSLITSCGACDQVCDGEHGVVKCSANYQCVIDETAGGCNTGYDNCDEDANNGCEAKLDSDALNCGACDKGCGGGTCTSGRCGAAIVLDPADTQSYNTVRGFLVGEQIVAAFSYSGWQLRTVDLPLGDSPSEGTLLQSYLAGQANISGMAVDATNAYFATSGSPYSVFKRALTGTGAATEVFKAPANAALLKVTSTAFYFGAAGTFYTVPKAGGAPTAIPSLTGRTTVYSMLVTPSRLYWTEYVTPQYRLFSAPLGGGTPVELDENVGYSYARLAYDGTHVYWSTYFASGKIRRVPAAATATSAVEDVAVMVTNVAEGIAVDDSYVYYRDGSYNVFRVVKDGTEEPDAITTLNSGKYFYDMFGVDDEFVYGTGSGGEILRVSKTP